MRVSDAASGKLITMRHEEKFICSERQLTLLSSRLSSLLPYDDNQSGDGYRIRSLYFDTPERKFFRESVNGVDHRRKYRIRFYNLDASFCRMERKDTEGRLKQKHSAKISQETVRELLEGGAFCDSENALMREVYLLQESEGLRPSSIVDYFRTAFTYPTGNIRITFDRNISCTDRVSEFFDKHALLLPVMPADRHILEVKYDGILPGFIARALDTGSLQQVSFSKYAYAMSHLCGNGRKEEGYEL